MQRTYHLAVTQKTALAPELADRLATLGQIRQFEGGNWIQQRGDDGDGFWLIRHGRVSVGRHGLEGEQTLFAILGAGDLFGELAYFAGTPRQVDAVAQEDAQLVWISHKLIARLLVEEEGFARNLLASLANQLRTALDRIDIARHGRAETRLAAALLAMAQDAGNYIRCTQQELADYIGVSRVRTGTLLAQFASDGWVKRGYGQIEISDHEALSRLLPM
ncbi:Crp/Fnr family transcriptional regulator [uncultured Sphingorhabdus sp.]|uniref:Crp/Fnr family transcriptional regulator n=1 Tax=uncultured Sphingorhabdus sp. TaxID=1686106 RepID=UPI00261A3AB9|nr:Crp/Fnr family transcriptional regulator [uncultured Sphingorhabdus sp.]HMS21460.1 Crp/Fnr family transcriptional regulator [Sphingorhabdus sp.]